MIARVMGMCWDWTRTGDFDIGNSAVHSYFNDPLNRFREKFYKSIVVGDCEEVRSARQSDVERRDLKQSDRIVS
jgi:hypothetical protein